MTSSLRICVPLAACSLLGILLPIANGLATADGGAVSIRSNFPGGNVAVQENEGSTVRVAPDLRGGRPWFYWCFETTATRPGKVSFAFPEKVAGFKHGAIGFQGPAISKDRGKTWRWMGTDSVTDGSFTYDFREKGEIVRFAVTIPYLQRQLDEFLKRNASNAHLERRVLAKSRGGREVELLRIGKPATDRRALLVTGRHHAAETMASYVLEGFLHAAMSDSTAGHEFRNKYVLYAIPFVDKDGVEKGDQGKNRKPHDHNRDYGEKSIYPEVRAIKQLHKMVQFRFALDFHCPTLVMKDHQVMYFVGAKRHPKYNFENVSEFARWIKKVLPENAPHGPLVWLREKDNPAPMNSRYFGLQQGMIMAATFEFPFAPPGKATDPDSCRRYGQAMLSAWSNTHFRDASDKQK